MWMRSLLSILLVMCMCTSLLTSSRTSFGAVSYVIGPQDQDVGATCTSLGGAWSGGLGACTLLGNLTLGQGSSILLEPGATLAVPSGVTFTVSGLVENQGGNLTNAGTVSVMPGAGINNLDSGVCGTVSNTGDVTNLGNITNYCVFANGSGGRLANNGTLQDQGTLANERGGSIYNAGSLFGVILNGSILNEGSITNDANGSISIGYQNPASTYLDTFNFTNRGTLNNQGLFVTFGNFTNDAGAAVTNGGNLTIASATLNRGNFSAALMANAGNITNADDGLFRVDGATLNNTGAIDNAGMLEQVRDVYSIINNIGMTTNSGSIIDYSYISNNGTLVNSGTIVTSVGCSVASCGTLSNFGSLDNAVGGNVTNDGNFGNANGTVVNAGNFTNLRTVLNAADSTLKNVGTLDNLALLSNSGSLENSGSLLTSYELLNSATIDNDASGSITNTRAIMNSGTIDNSGSVTNSCGGVIDGPGTVVGDPVLSTSGCSTAGETVTTETTVTSVNSTSSSPIPAPEFPAWAVPSVLLFGLVLVSLLARSMGGGSSLGRPRGIRARV
jgi:filamentous hemagglutinin